MRRISLLLFLLAVAACKKDGDTKSSLPPASGSGAAPLPDLPDLAAGSGSAAPAEAAANPTFTGTLQAVEEVQVAARASGTLVELDTDEGKHVKKGQVLFRLDSRNAQLMRKQAQTQLSGAKLQLKTAQREHDRLAGLVAQNAAPQQQLDQLESQVEGAQVAIDAASNSIAMANQQINDATTVSPLDGVVIKKLKNVGEYVTLMPPSPVLIVQDQSRLELHFSVPDSVIPDVHIGSDVTVNLSSLKTSRDAKISKIAPMVDPRTRTIELTAVLDNHDGALMPGLMAEVSLGAAPAPAPTPAPAAGSGSGTSQPPSLPASQPAKPSPKAAKPKGTKP